MSFCNSSGKPGKPNSKPSAIEQVCVAPNSKPSVAEQHVSAAERKLRKKIRECEALEAVLAAGKQLEANQIAKMQGKATLIKELERLQPQVC